MAIDSEKLTGSNPLSLCLSGSRNGLQEVFEVSSTSQENSNETCTIDHLHVDTLKITGMLIYTNRSPYGSRTKQKNGALILVSQLPTVAAAFGS